MLADTLAQSLRTARNSFRAYADTAEGASRIRLALIAVTILAYARPDPHGLGPRILVFLLMFFQYLGIIVIILFIVPGLMTVTLCVCHFLLWILFIIDAVLFYRARIFLRKTLRLGVALSLLLALSLEAFVVVGGYRYTAAACRTQPGSVVPHGVYQPQKHGRERYRNLFPRGRPPGVGPGSRPKSPRPNAR